MSSNVGRGGASLPIRPSDAGAQRSPGRRPKERQSSSHIVLVACARTKTAGRNPAKDLYTSEWFRDARRVAEQYASDWFILSAKHGLVTPNRALDPYDLSLADQTSEFRARWADSVVHALGRACPNMDRLSILAGHDYSAPLVPSLRPRSTALFAPLLFRHDELQRGWMRQRVRASQRIRDMEMFHSLMGRLMQLTGTAPLLRDLTSSSFRAARGVYFFLDDAQPRWTDSSPRVVRVGTHAVSAGSRSSLWGRLRAHRGNLDLGGNHRSSIFRLHVGAALLAEGKTSAAASWGRVQGASAAVLRAEADLERKVSSYIGSLRVVWIEVPDAPSPYSDRAYLERNSIALLAGPLGPLDPPTEDWLGRCSSHDVIRTSGLWNLDHVRGEYTAEFLGVLESYVAAREGRRPLPSASIAPAGWNARWATHEQGGQVRLFEETD